MNAFKYSCKRQSNVGQTDPELTQWCNDNEDRYTLYIDIFMQDMNHSLMLHLLSKHC